MPQEQPLPVDHVITAAMVQQLGVAPPVLRIAHQPVGRYGMCFYDALAYAKENGGEAVLGWRFLHLPGVFAIAEHHAVWRSPSGELIDIIPLEQTGFTFDAISFLPDGRYTPEWGPAPAPYAELFCQIRHTKLVSRFSDLRTAAVYHQGVVRDFMRKHNLHPDLGHKAPAFQAAFERDPEFKQAFEVWDQIDEELKVVAGRVYANAARREADQTAG